MTAEAVRRTYRAYLDQLADELRDVVAEEFGGGLLGRVAGRGAKPVLEKIKREMHQQGRLLVAYAASEDDADRERLANEFVETNPVYKRYDGDRGDELEAELREHFREAAADLRPLIVSDADEFWAAMRETYSREEAEEIVERHFSQAQTFTKYRDGVFSSRTIGEKVIGVVETGERRLRDSIAEELARAYDGAS